MHTTMHYRLTDYTYMLRGVYITGMYAEYVTTPFQYSLLERYYAYNKKQDGTHGVLNKSTAHIWRKHVRETHIKHIYRHGMSFQVTYCGVCKPC